MHQPDQYKADLNRRNYDYLIGFMREQKLHSLSEALNLIIDRYRFDDLIKTLKEIKK